MRSAIVAMLLACASCGDNRGGAPDAAVDAAVDAGVVTAECERWWHAVAGAPEPCAALPYTPERVADLRARFLRRCAQAESLPGSGFDAAWIDACIASREAQGCDVDAVPVPSPVSWQDMPAGCEPPAGSLPAGTPCGAHHQCASGWCDLDETAGCGTCAEVSLQGQSCADRRCEPGTWCDLPDQICRRFPTEAGARCVGLDCGFGFFCDATNVCCPLSAPGGPCTGRDEDCQDGRCVDHVCARRDLPLDASCSPSPSLCAPGLGCVDGTCRPLLTLANGEACGWSGTDVCVEGTCTCVTDEQCGYGAPYECRPDLATGCATGGACVIVDARGCPLAW